MIWGEKVLCNRKKRNWSVDLNELIKKGHLESSISMLHVYIYHHTHHRRFWASLHVLYVDLDITHIN
jgi:hypothetical protein